MAIRSALLARHKLTSTSVWTTVATVPAGELWLVKSVYVYNGASTSGNFNLRIADSTATLFGILVVKTIGGFLIDRWDGWAAANAGDLLQVWCDAQPFYSHWSGARLQA